MTNQQLNESIAMDKSIRLPTSAANQDKSLVMPSAIKPEAHDVSVDEIQCFVAPLDHPDAISKEVDGLYEEAIIKLETD